MKSLIGNSSPVRGWALLLALLLGAGMMISACGEEEVPAPTTPTPPPPPPTPTPPPTPEPTGPAVPTGLKSSGGAGYIEWTWNTVEGAFGYQGQFSTDAQFTDADQSVLIIAPATSHRVHDQATGYFRVRSGAGTSQADLQFSDWSDAVSGTAGPAPTPTPTPTTTPLSTPGNVRTSSRQNSAITVAWDGVDDAEAYEVQQQAAGAGSWSSASCSGADNQVTVTECVASGLDRGTAYGFRVRAVPDAADTDLAPSAWSSAVSATTTGRPAITIEDGGLNLQWKSELDAREDPAAHAITWIWDPVVDRALQPLVDHYVALLDPEDSDQCPSLDDRFTSATTETLEDATANYGRWLNLDSDISVTVRGVGGTDGSADAGAAGEVRGLCVVRTWEDDRGIRQFGEVSLALASTVPFSPTDATGSLNPLERQNAVTRATTSIGWNYQTDAGFTYTLRMLSTSRDNASPDDVAECAGGDAVASPREINNYDFAVAYRESTVMPFRHYRLCIRAENERGSSEWAFVGGAAQTRPAAPSAPTFVAGESEVGTETYGGHTVNRLVWSAAERTGTPTNGALHDAEIFYTTQRSISASSVQDVCDAPTTGGRATLEGGPTPTLINTNDGFEIEVSAAPLLGGASGSVVPAAITSEPNAYYVYLCVRANPAAAADPTLDAAADIEGPWSISSPRTYAAGVPADVTGLANDGTFTTVGRVKWDWTAANSAGGLVPDGFEIRIDGGTVRTVSRTTPTYTHSAPSGTSVQLEVRQYRTVAGRRLVGGWQSVTTATN